MRLPLLAAALLPLLCACASLAPVTGPAAGADPVVADDNLNAVLWVQRSAEYRALAAQTYRSAGRQLDVALATPQWDALVPAERQASGRADGLPPAVIMDVDETVLDNSPYQARLVRDGLEYDDATWDAWVEERTAKPVPGVVEFARAATAKGVTVIYLSNRAQHLKDATLANLRAEGLPVQDDSVFLGLGTVVPGCEQKGSEKLCRRRHVASRYRVLMQFGDQLGDFAEVSPNTVAHRGALLEAHGDWFGARWWMLPNPTYGSWEPALFDNGWKAPRPERRRLKRQALDTAE